MKRFATLDACVELVRDAAEAYADPHFRHRGVFAREVVLPEGGTVPALPMPGFGQAGARRAPRLGGTALDAADIWTPAGA